MLALFLLRGSDHVRPGPKSAGLQPPPRPTFRPEESYNTPFNQSVSGAGSRQRLGVCGMIGRSGLICRRPSRPSPFWVTPCWPSLGCRALLASGGRACASAALCFSPLWRNAFRLACPSQRLLRLLREACGAQPGGGARRSLRETFTGHDLGGGAGRRRDAPTTHHARPPDWTPASDYRVELASYGCEPFL